MANQERAKTLGHHLSMQGRLEIGADLGENVDDQRLHLLLESFAALHCQHPEARLTLAWRRQRSTGFSAQNWVEIEGLEAAVRLFPYLDYCRELPLRKRDAALWIDGAASDDALKASGMLRALASPPAPIALFVTAMDPGKPEGNSAGMRQWLEHLRSAGYRIHILLYGMEPRAKGQIRLAYPYDLLQEVPVETASVGSNRNGLNVHVDEWCGIELIEAAAAMARRTSYDVAIVNYAFLSAVFEGLPAYTHKILFTHDRFADRNRRMLNDGMSESSWVSITRDGEATACLRSDTVAAVQNEEADYFRELTGGSRDVRVIGPVPRGRIVLPPPPAARLRVGYLGSANWVNETNVVQFLRSWADQSPLIEGAELLLAGGLCETLSRFDPDQVTDKVRLRMLGPRENLAEVYAEIDLFINPERGGTGIKIKTVEALAHGVPVVTTVAGAVGIGSTSRFHAAPDLVALAELLAEIARNPAMLDEVRRDSTVAWEAYVGRHRRALSDLLGPSRIATSVRRGLPVTIRAPGETPVVPDYVARTAADYHLPEFRQVWDRFDLNGKRVLEVGSDFHFASARLFHANGAAEVVATNLGNWISDEPLPEGIRFVCGDVADVADHELTSGSFDIVYGIAVLEHIPDLDRVARTVTRLLAPGGVVYFQGCPLWPGALGHHVWLSAEALADDDPTAKNRLQMGQKLSYNFADEMRNLIPNWAHLSKTQDELRTLLIDQGIPVGHASPIVEFVYNHDGKHTGICSNFRAASEVVAAFESHLAVLPDPMVYADPTSPHYQAAKAKYSEADLSALGLRLWATLPQDAGGLAELQPPTVSVVVPFWGVEAYIGACIESVQAQDFADFELILVDDASLDGSRDVALRYAAQDPRVRIVSHTHNQGLGPARNTGAQHARGRLILFLDSDDLLAGPLTLGRMVAVAQETKAQVVVGSCETLMPDGSRTPFDRDHDNKQGGHPGRAMSGLNAYCAAMYFPGAGYLPSRAWGTLIDGTFYRELALDFPPGEHEDLAHTPILYWMANAVHYLADICILYRQRNNSLSRTSWSAEKIARYSTLWQTMRTNMTAHGLADEVPDAAVKMADHLVWKLGQNNLATGAEPAFQDTLSALMADAREARHATIARQLIGALESPPFLDSLGAAHARSALLPALAAPMMDYLREGLSHQPAALRRTAALEIGAAIPATSPTKFETTGAFEANDRLATEIINAYEATASEDAKSFPAMLTLADRAIYFHVGRTFGNRGSIVDAGCFVGGTTRNLVEGLHHNKLFSGRQRTSKGLIRVYDLFAVDDDYILEHLQRNYPTTDFSGEGSFLPVFQRNMAPFAELLDVRPGDVTGVGYPDGAPIEVLGVDLCKALFVTDFTVRAFFPRLLPDAWVLQQDYIHEFHPYIHLSMLRLEAHFRTEVEFRWGGTVAFRLTRPITAADLHDAFGPDDTWYGDVATNTKLLQRLIADAHYDENRWIYYLTLAIYLTHNGRHAQARAVFDEARTRFPAFTPADNTFRMVYEKDTVRS